MSKIDPVQQNQDLNDKLILERDREIERLRTVMQQKNEALQDAWGEIEKLKQLLRQR